MTHIFYPLWSEVDLHFLQRLLWLWKEVAPLKYKLFVESLSKSCLVDGRNFMYLRHRSGTSHMTCLQGKTSARWDPSVQKINPILQIIYTVYYVSFLRCQHHQNHTGTCVLFLRLQNWFLLVFRQHPLFFMNVSPMKDPFPQGTNLHSV